MAETTEILKIEVDVASAVKQIEKYKARIAEIKKSQTELKKQLKDGQITFDEYTDAVASTTVELQATQTALQDTQKELKNTITANNENERSLRSMRAELSSLTQAYDKMSEAQRNASKGQELQQQIKDLSDEIKDLEGETGRFYRNVGNYEEAIKNAIGSMHPFLAGLINIGEESKKIKEEAEKAGKSMSTMGATFRAAGNSAKAFSKALLSLLANPVVAIIAGIAMVIMTVVKAMKSSEEQTERLQVLFAPFERGLTAIMAGFQKLSAYVVTFAEATMKAVTATAEFLGISKEVSDATQNAIQLKKDEIALKHKERDAIVKNAETDKEVAQLKAQFAEKDKYTAEQRLGFINKAIDLEKDRAANEVEIAKERLRIETEKAKWADNDEETNQRLAELAADVIRKETDYYNKERELNAQKVEAGNQVLAEQAKITQEELKLMQLRVDASIEGSQLEYNLKIDLLKRQMEEELKNKELTEEQKLLIQQKYNKKLDEEADKFWFSKVRKEMKQNEDRWANEIARLELEGATDLEIQRKVADQKKEYLDGMQQTEDESLVAFNTRKLQAEKDYNDQLALIKQTEMQIRMNAANAVGQVFGAMGQMLDAAGENNLAAVKLQQTLAIAEVMIAQGVAIAQATKTAAGSSFSIWDLIANIAIGVATVTTTIVQAIKTIKSTKEKIAEAEAEKSKSSGGFATVKGYATGGLVTGAGTGTSDSIPAMLSNGEFVIPAATYKAFSGIIDPIYRMGQSMSAPIPRTTNVGTTQSQGGNIGADMLSEAFAKGASKIHLSPTVSVTEINSKQNNVKAVEARNTMRV